MKKTLLILLTGVIAGTSGYKSDDDDMNTSFSWKKCLKMMPISCQEWQSRPMDAVHQLSPTVGYLQIWAWGSYPLRTGKALSK